MPWLLAELIYHVVIFYIVGMFAVGVLKDKSNLSFRLKASLVILIFSFSVFATQFNSSILGYIPYLNIVTNLLCHTLLILVLCRTKWYRAFLLASLLIFLALYSELLLGLFILAPDDITWDDAEPVTPGGYRSILIAFQCLFVFLLCKTVIFVKKRADTKTQIILAVFFLATFVLVWLIIYNSDFSIVFGSMIRSFNSLLIVLFFILLCSVAFLLFKVFIQHNEKEKRLALTEEQIFTQKEHISQIVQKQTQFQQMSHDFKQHIHTLQGLYDSGNLEEISDMLQKLSQQQSNGVRITATGNTMLDALLSIKREIAEKENILCDWNVAIPPRLPIGELDTCAILGNALDNAIEACRKITETEPFIKLDMYIESDWLLCSVVNPISTPPNVEKGFFKTSKQNAQLHGLGIISMKRCCENLGGNLEVFYDEKKFTVRFMLPVNVVGA